MRILLIFIISTWFLCCLSRSNYLSVPSVFLGSYIQPTKLDYSKCTLDAVESDSVNLDKNTITRTFTLDGNLPMGASMCINQTNVDGSIFMIYEVEIIGAGEYNVYRKERDFVDPIELERIIDGDKDQSCHCPWGMYKNDRFCKDVSKLGYHCKNVSTSMECYSCFEGMLKTKSNGCFFGVYNTEAFLRKLESAEMRSLYFTKMIPVPILCRAERIWNGYGSELIHSEIHCQELSLSNQQVFNYPNISLITRVGMELRDSEEIVNEVLVTKNKDIELVLPEDMIARNKEEIDKIGANQVSLYVDFEIESDITKNNMGSMMSYVFNKCSKTQTTTHLFKGSVNKMSLNGMFDPKRILEKKDVLLDGNDIVILEQGDVSGRITYSFEGPSDLHSNEIIEAATFTVSKFSAKISQVLGDEPDVLMTLSAVMVSNNQWSRAVVSVILNDAEVRSFQAINGANDVIIHLPTSLLFDNNTLLLSDSFGTTLYQGFVNATFREIDFDNDLEGNKNETNIEEDEIDEADEEKRSGWSLKVSQTGLFFIIVACFIVIVIVAVVAHKMNWVERWSSYRDAEKLKRQYMEIQQREHQTRLEEQLLEKAKKNMKEKPLEKLEVVDW